MSPITNRESKLKPPVNDKELPLEMRTIAFDKPIYDKTKDASYNKFSYSKKPDSIPGIREYVVTLLHDTAQDSYDGPIAVEITMTGESTGIIVPSPELPKKLKEQGVIEKIALAMGDLKHMDLQLIDTPPIVDTPPVEKVSDLN